MTSAPTERRADVAGLLGVAAWIGLGASGVTLAVAVGFLVQGFLDSSDLAGLGVLAAVVLGVLGAVGVALAVLVLRWRGARPQPAAWVALALGLALFPIWSAGLSYAASGSLDALGALQLPVPLAVVALAVVSLVRLRRAPVGES